MNIIPEWMVLCERVVRDTDSSELSLRGLLDGVAVPELPALHNRFAFVARLRRGDGEVGHLELECRFMRCCEADGELEVFQLGLDWPPEAHFARVYHNFAILKLRRPERLTFRLDYRRKGVEAWSVGPSAVLEVQRSELSAQQAADLAKVFESAGLELPSWLRASLESTRSGQVDSQG